MPPAEEIVRENLGPGACRLRAGTTVVSPDPSDFVCSNTPEKFHLEYAIAGGHLFLIVEYIVTAQTVTLL